GKIIKPESHVYIVMNKPVGYVCAVSDKYDEVVINLLSKEDKLTRVFPVGRLDRDSEGLLILTNDGEFANNISHPSKSNKLGVNKEYEALLNIEINLKQLERWRGGFDIEVEDEIKNIKPLAVNIIDREPVNKWLSIIIAEGVKREIRLMANKAGFSVEKLIRVKIGNLKLEDFNLKPGEYVKLSFNEINNKIFNK
ncbi:MAG: rRNA pseudouridine synthase, partial [Synergistaceae bacterium]|nr:rRNA pseudouridine synthase [Synergistaceae bacterium]